jgi:hypothetical protein
LTTSRTRAVTLLITALVVGIIVGGSALTMAVRKGKADFVFRGMRGPGGRGNGGRDGGGKHTEWLARELNITVGAAVADSINAIYCRRVVGIDSVLASYQERNRPLMDSLYEGIRPEIEARRDQSRSGIRALLTPDQRVRYDSMIAVDDSSRRAMRSAGPRPFRPAGPCYPGSTDGSSGSTGRGGASRGTR